MDNDDIVRAILGPIFQSNISRVTVFFGFLLYGSSRKCISSKLNNLALTIGEKHKTKARLENYNLLTQLSQLLAKTLW